MKNKSAQEVLEDLVGLLEEHLRVLSMGEAKNQFLCGEKYAYVECLEVIQSWGRAADFGLDYDIEERFPL